MQANFMQKLHRSKKSINKIHRGVDFVGFTIKPNRIFIRQKTIKKAFRIVDKWHTSLDWLAEAELNNFRVSINSYLGMLQPINGYNLRKKICLKINNLFIHSDKNCSKLLLQ